MNVVLAGRPGEQGAHLEAGGGCGERAGSQGRVLRGGGACIPNGRSRMSYGIGDTSVKVFDARQGESRRFAGRPRRCVKGGRGHDRHGSKIARLGRQGRFKLERRDGKLFAPTPRSRGRCSRVATSATTKADARAGWPIKAKVFDLTRPLTPRRPSAKVLTSRGTGPVGQRSHDNATCRDGVRRTRR